MRRTQAKVAATTTAVVLALWAMSCAAADTAAGLPAEPSVAQVQTALMAHRTTVAAMAQHYLQRIDALDTHGPALHSIIQVNPDAAARLERQWNLQTPLTRIGRIQDARKGIDVLRKDGAIEALKNVGYEHRT